jgi:hypothetical protein
MLICSVRGSILGAANFPLEDERQPLQPAQNNYPLEVFALTRFPVRGAIPRS